MSEAMERLLAAAESNGCRPRKSRRGWMAHCPAHDDLRSSLSIAEGDDGRALVHCHASCPPEAVAAALGLEMRDLMPEREANGKPAEQTFPTAEDAQAALERQLGQSPAGR